MAEVSIIGAGVVGLCVANELLARNVKVSIYDKKTEAGPHACSWWAGGMLAPFCESESAEEEVCRFGQEAAAWWSKRTNVINRGSLVVASSRDGADFNRFRRLTSNHELVSGESIADLEPDLSDKFARALFFENEAHIDPRIALRDLTNQLRQAGVEISTAEPPKDSTKRIDCRGLAAKDVLHDLRGVKGEMLVIRTNDVSFQRPIRLLHPRLPLYIVPRGNGVFMLGATTIESEDRENVSVRSMLELLSAAYALSPSFGEAEILEIGVDLRPAFKDNLPKIRKIDDVIYANGLYRHGYLLAPAVAKQVADLLLDDTAGEFVDENYH